MSDDNALTNSDYILWFLLCLTEIQEFWESGASWVLLDSLLITEGNSDEMILSLSIYFVFMIDKWLIELISELM